MSADFEVRKMPDAFEEFQAAVEREFDVMASPLDLIKGLHLVVVNMTHTLESLGRDVNSVSGSGRHELTGQEVMKELEK